MITLVVGGQYGGEGKGKVSAFLSRNHPYDAVCRTGGINSRHTVVENGKAYDLRQLPTSCVNQSFSGKVVFGAGSLVHIRTLFEEMDLLGIPQSRILIDKQTGIILDDCVAAQRADERYTEIGSTLTGTGYATAQRALRKLPLAQHFAELNKMTGDVPSYLHDLIIREKDILIEGHQSAGLSNYHGDYPYTSNRDSIAAALLSELGIGIRNEFRVVLVIKAFPTRNHKGRLPNEMKVEDADKIGIKEFGGGSWNIENRRRRVAKISIEDIERAVILNAPSEIVLTGVDYLDSNAKDSTEYESVSTTVKELISEIEGKLHLPVSMLSTGAETSSMIVRKI